MKSFMPDADDEELYQRTRRIVVAEMQNVVYGQWLREILGPELYAKSSLDPMADSTYEPETEPIISNAFATAAFRFGHALLKSDLKRTTTMLQDNLLKRNESVFRLQNHFFNSTEVDVDMEAVLNGLQFQNSKLFDSSVITDVTENLFRNVPEMRAGDLVARNIQRGRDHGLPGYNAFRKVGTG